MTAAVLGIHAMCSCWDALSENERRTLNAALGPELMRLVGCYLKTFKTTEECINYGADSREQMYDVYTKQVLTVQQEGVALGKLQALFDFIDHCNLVQIMPNEHCKSGT